MPEDDIVSRLRNLAEKSRFLQQRPTIAGGVVETDLQRDIQDKVWTANPWEAAKASFTSAYQENITGKIGDTVNSYLAAREESQWLDPEEANSFFQPEVPYTQPIKLSLAAYDNVVKERRQEQARILNRIDENALGSTILPLAAGIGGSILDPAALAAGYGVSAGLKALGTTAAMNGTRFGKFIAQGSVIDGEFAYGSMSQQVTGELFDQFIGNAMIAPATMLGDIATNNMPSIEHMIEETIIGTMMGTGLSLGLRFALTRNTNSPTGKALEAETAMNQADEGLKINVDPVHKARENGLKEAPVKETPSELGARMEVGSQAKPKPVGEFKVLRLYLPMDAKRPGFQLHPSNTRLGINTIQMTDNLAVARNTSFDPLNPLNSKIEVGQVDYADMNILDANVRTDVPALEKLYTDMFGGEMPDGFTLKDFIEEAQFKDAKSVVKIEETIREAGYDGFSYREGNVVDGHNVIELFKGKDYKILDKNFIEEARNIDPEANRYLADPANYLESYSKDYNNKIIADENRIEWKEPVPELPKTAKEEIPVLKQEIADIDAELKAFDDLDTIVEDTAVVEFDKLIDDRISPMLNRIKNNEIVDFKEELPKLVDDILFNNNVDIKFDDDLFDAVVEFIESGIIDRVEPLNEVMGKKVHKEFIDAHRRMVESDLVDDIKRSFGEKTELDIKDEEGGLQTMGADFSRIFGDIEEEIGFVNLSEMLDVMPREEFLNSFKKFNLTDEELGIVLDPKETKPTEAFNILSLWKEGTRAELTRDLFTSPEAMKQRQLVRDRHSAFLVKKGFDPAKANKLTDTLINLLEKDVRLVLDKRFGETGLSAIKTPEIEVIPEGISGKPRTTAEIQMDEAQKWAKENDFDLLDELDEEFHEYGETFFDDSDRFDTARDFEDPVELRETYEERMREQARESKVEEADEARSATKALDFCNKKRT